MKSRFKKNFRRQKLGYLTISLLAFLTLGNSVSVAEENIENPELSSYYPIKVIPDVPALNIKTATIEDGNYTAPHIPAIRTSNDGRVGLYIKREAGNTRLFTTIRPEAVTAPFDLLEPGIPNGFLSDIFPQDLGVGHHTTICDGSSVFPESPHKNPYVNPMQCGENDCYYLSLIGAKSVTDPDTNVKGTKLVQTKFEVKIKSPKTTQAELLEINQIGGDIESSFMPGVDTYLEPMFTADGRVLVFRMRSQSSTTDFHWQTDDGTTKSGSYDMVYGVIPEDAEACDITKMEGPYPISHAPFHAKVKDKYGFAQQQFRDPEGNLLDDGEPLKGTYPWIDREGRNLFFTAIRSRLYYNTGIKDINWRARYDSRCIEECQDNANLEDGFHTQGVMAMGAWTNGKMVLLDGAFANSDYGLASTTDVHREINLYTDENNEKIWERVGSARDTRSTELPEFGAKNTTFIDSIENLFNAYPNLLPDTPRDVVWRFSTGRATADVAFDDFLNKHSVIVANMNASMTHDVADEGDVPRSYTRNHLNMRHNDGFEDFYNHGGRGFTKNPRIQNAATGTGNFIPKYGKTYGNVRIEPIAKGGIIGKGLWLDGQSGVSFNIGKTLEQAFVSLFVDPRQLESDERARLLTFADNSTLELSHAILRYQVGGSSEQGHVFELDLSEFSFTDKIWRHLALQFHKQDAGAVKLDVFINGFLLAQWETPLHQAFVSGELKLGAVDTTSVNGFRGWLDEFKVLAYQPDFESVCNHGHGSLVGIPAASQNAKWSAVASKYDSTHHQAVSASVDQTKYATYAQYACVHNYQEERGFAKEKAVNPDLFKALTKTTLRQPVLFPEGPLKWDYPRPDSSNNGFCLECHDSSHAFAPLSLSVLTLDTDTVSQHDLRRQPMQPPRLMAGKASALLTACEYNKSVLVSDNEQKKVTLVDECLLTEPQSKLESDTLYRIIHLATNAPIRVKNWDTVENNRQQGYPVTLEQGGLAACDGAECDFLLREHEGFHSINPSDGITTTPLGVLGLKAKKDNGENLANIILRRRVGPLLAHCSPGECEFTIRPLGGKKFRIEIAEGYAIGNLGTADNRLQTLNVEDCGANKCDFSFEPVNLN